MHRLYGRLALAGAVLAVSAGLAGCGGGFEGQNRAEQQKSFEGRTPSAHLPAAVRGGYARRPRGRGPEGSRRTDCGPALKV